MLEKGEEYFTHGGNWGKIALFLYISKNMDMYQKEKSYKDLASIKILKGRLIVLKLRKYVSVKS